MKKIIDSRLLRQTRNLFGEQAKLAQEFRKEFRRQLLTLVTAAFAFVAAFFWNEAIKSMILTFVPTADVWQYQLLTALAVTLIAVAAIFLISRYAKE